MVIAVMVECVFFLLSLSVSRSPVEFPMVMLGEKCQITKLFSFYSILNLSMAIVCVCVDAI